MSSIRYYDKNMQSFHDRTFHSDLSHVYEKFLPSLPKAATILDAGCGSGRDACYFKQLGYCVTAFDGSIEMVKKATEMIGHPALHLQFDDLTFEKSFDAIWAHASLLHVPYIQMRNVFEKLHRALKPEGLFFASFKHGDGKRLIDDRVFYDMDENTILPYLDGLFSAIDIWTSPDNNQIVASPSKMWLRVLCIKTGI